MSKETGGPAFPVEAKLNPISNQACIYQTGDGHLYQFPGMTLRDYFAKEALGLCFAQYLNHAEAEGFSECWREGVANDAYLMADAMLAARNK